MGAEAQHRGCDDLETSSGEHASAAATVGAPPGEGGGVPAGAGEARVV